MYTQKLKINRFCELLNDKTFTYLFFEDYQLREEATMNLTDLELVRDWFLIIIDIKRINEDQKMLNNWNAKILETIRLSEEGITPDNILEINDYKEQLKSFKDHLSTREEKITNFLTKNNIKMHAWREKMWFKSSNIYKISFWKMIINHVLQPNIQISEEKFSDERFKINMELDNAKKKSLIK